MRNKKFGLVSGFTLIETLIVILIVAVIVPAFFTIFLGILRQQARTTALTETKNQGDYALALMSQMIRTNAQAVFSSGQPFNETDKKCDLSPEDDTSYPVPPGDGADFYFRDASTIEAFRFYLDSNKIASESSITGTSVDLTDSRVKITNFKISCSNSSSFSQPVISLSFDAQYQNQSAESAPTLKYQTKVKIRSQ